jgi:hypothetical protein
MNEQQTFQLLNHTHAHITNEDSTVHFDMQQFHGIHETLDGMRSVTEIFHDVIPVYLYSQRQGYLQNSHQINCESNQENANTEVNLLFLVNPTCFGRRFRPSSGALDRIYSV